MKTRPAACFALVTLIEVAAVAAPPPAPNFGYAERVVSRVATTSSYFSDHKETPWPDADEDFIRRALYNGEPERTLFTESELKQHAKAIAKAVKREPSPLSVVAVELQAISAVAIERRRQFLAARLAEPDAPVEGLVKLTSEPPRIETELEAVWAQLLEADIAELQRVGHDRAQARAILRDAYATDSGRSAAPTFEDVFEFVINLAYNQLDPRGSYIGPMAPRREIVLDDREGVGLALQRDAAGRFTTIARVLPGGAAESQGVLRPGDVIVAVTVNGVTHQTIRREIVDVIDLIRSPAGTKVRLHIVPRPNEDGTLVNEAELVSGPIEATVSAKVDIVFIGRQPPNPSAQHYFIELPRMVSDFNARGRGEKDHASTTRTLATWLEHTKPTGIVLDLRGNSGGPLTEVAGIAQILGADLDRASIHSKSKQEPFSARLGAETTTRFDGALVVLVDGATATGGEMLAAILQDGGRALVIGGRTWGMGGVQTVVSLDRFLRPEDKITGGLGDLKITIGEVCIGKTGLEGAGVTPDIDWRLATSSRDVSVKSRCADVGIAPLHAESSWRAAVRSVAKAHQPPPAMTPRAELASASLDRFVLQRASGTNDAEKKAAQDYAKAFVAYRSASPFRLSDETHSQDVVALEAAKLLDELSSAGARQP